LEFFGLLGVVAVFTILIGSIMGFVANSRITRVELELKKLRRELKGQIGSSRPAMPARQTPKETLVKAKKPEPIKKALNEKTQELEQPKLQSPKPKSPPPKPKKARRSFEEELGARWAVWVGGLALFLGAVFLLRYTIEAGFFTPIMRVALTCLLGVGLLGTGEFLRRADHSGKNIKLMDTELAKSLSNNADIPGILTAIGIFALLGAAYAAYALYGLIGPIPAFILKGLLSLGALALGLLHGPKLAALGLVASLATPQLVQSDPPNAYNLYIYLIIVGFAALALARKRSWGWLNFFTLFGMLGWIFMSMAATKGTGTHLAWLGFLATTFAAGTFISSAKPVEDKKLSFSTLEYGPRMAIIWAVGAAFALCIAGLENDLARPHYISGLIAVAVLMATAWFRPRQSLHILTAGCLGMILVLGNLDNQPWQECLIAGVILSAVFIWLCHTRIREQADIVPEKLRLQMWPGLAVILPVLFFFAFYSIDSSMGAKLGGLVFLVLSAAYAGQSYLNRRLNTENDTSLGPASIYALGAGLAYMIVVAIAFTGMAETVGFIAGIALAALAARFVPIRAMGVIAGGFSLLVAANVLFIRVPEAGAVSDRILFNALWVYFALPAVVCAAAAWELRKSRRDLWTEGLKSMVLVFAALFAIFQIRHAMNGGSLLAERFSLEELSMQVLVGLCFTLGGTMVGPQKVDAKAPVYENFIPILAIGVSLVALAVFILGVCLGKAPLFNDLTPIRGGFVLNSLLLAYLLPALLLVAIAWLSRGKRPKAYVQLVAGLSLVSIMHYVTGMIRHGFSGDTISIFKKFPDNAELYSISAAWLALGIALLVLGIKSKRQDVRMASAIVIMLTVVKAFFVDMASLEGVLRAISFVVLGLVLIIIGRVYQRLLFSKQPAQNPE
jgi:uncharacterized membrane protein